MSTKLSNLDIEIIGDVIATTLKVDLVNVSKQKYKKALVNYDRFVKTTSGNYYRYL